jgi:hypothetical protein
MYALPRRVAVCRGQSSLQVMGPQSLACYNMGDIYTVLEYLVVITQTMLDGHLHVPKQHLHLHNTHTITLLRYNSGT